MEIVNQWLSKHVRFNYSPFREFMTSLHVRYNPAHHLTRLEWAEKIKSNMSTSWDSGVRHIFKTPFLDNRFGTQNIVRAFFEKKIKIRSTFGFLPHS